VNISLRALTKRFGSGDAAVTDLSLEIPAGEIVALVGPSGCGKTTTLKMINRLIEPTEGQIGIGGVDARSVPVQDLRRHIGYVIQQTGLFPHLRIDANIATVPRLLGWPRKRIAERVEELADVVGLEHDMLRRYPPELSGGQQQRVGVARALAANPPVLLMDEPYSAIDPIVRARLQDELIELQARLQKTIVLVTHDIDEAIKLGDHIAILNIGGTLEQFDTPRTILRQPANEFVSSFLGNDRGLKRLSLLSVSDVEVSPGPVVSPGASATEAFEVMEVHGTDWVGILDGDRLEGWIGRDVLHRGGSVEVSSAQPFVSQVDSATSLRVALDGIVTSKTQVAVVIDDGRYVGVVTLDQISSGAEK